MSCVPKCESAWSTCACAVAGTSCECVRRCEGRGLLVIEKPWCVSVGAEGRAPMEGARWLWRVVGAVSWPLLGSWTGWARRVWSRV